MKYTLTILALLLFTQNIFCQSKKKQIEILSRRLDSLQEVNSTQLRLIDQSSTRINELNVNLTNSNKSIKDLEAQFQDCTSEINLQKAEIKKLQSEIKAKTDSISFLIWEKPDMRSLDTIEFASIDPLESSQGSLDEVINYLGVYQSEEACELYMPRFTHKMGPTMEIKISGFSEYESDPSGDWDEYKYYASIKYSGDYSGQLAENNEKEFYSEIVKFQQEGKSVKMTLHSSNCAEYFTNSPDVRQGQKMLDNTFILSMKFLANGKVIMSTENAPVLCHHDWGFDNVTFYPLVWSR
jgi:hypothetical protein